MDKVIDQAKFIANVFSSMMEFALFKTVGSVFYIAYAFSFDQTQATGLKALFILIIMDFITGLWAAKMNGEEIKSSKIFRSAIKMVLYFLMISAAHLAELAVPLLHSFVDETTLAFLALTELISVMENVGKLGFSVPQKLLNKLQDFRDKK